MTRFELATSAPPVQRSNQAEPHPACGRKVSERAGRFPGLIRLLSCDFFALVYQMGEFEGEWGSPLWISAERSDSAANQGYTAGALTAYNPPHSTGASWSAKSIAKPTH